MQVHVVRRASVMVVVVALLVIGWMAVSSRASAASATPVVYVATGENFPDALGASAAGAVRGGPVLLVTKTSIPAETAGELSRLSSDVIYVAGGSAVVSDTVFNALKVYAGSVVRVAGANRYATAVEVSKSAFPATGGAVGGGGDTAVLEAQVSALAAEVDALQALLAGVSRNGDTLMFEGMNVQVTNGRGETETSNGLGNVIIGYNEDSGGDDDRSGSHYLIVGTESTYSSYSGIVAGRSGRATGEYASVLGGQDNRASGRYSTVLGGFHNHAAQGASTVAGGSENWANGYAASVTGGDHGIADGEYASVSGGQRNTASGYAASVIGGSWGLADGSWSSVTGGNDNEALGSYTSVIGGQTNTAYDRFSSITAGFNNHTYGDWSSVTGGRASTTAADYASVSGGTSNYAGGWASSILGGSSKTAPGTNDTFPAGP